MMLRTENVRVLRFHSYINLNLQRILMKRIYNIAAPTYLRYVQNILLPHFQHVESFISYYLTTLGSISSSIVKENVIYYLYLMTSNTTLNTIFRKAIVLLVFI